MARSKFTKEDTVRSGDIRSFFSTAKAEESKSAATTGPAANRDSEKLSLSKSDPAESMTVSVPAPDEALGKRKRPQAKSAPTDTKDPSDQGRSIGKRKRSKKAEPESDIETDDTDSDPSDQEFLQAAVDEVFDVDVLDPSSQEYGLLKAVAPELLDDVDGPDTVSEQTFEIDNGLPNEQAYHRDVFHRLLIGAGQYTTTRCDFPYKAFLTRYSEEDLYRRLKASTRDIIWAECVEKRNGLSAEFLSELPDDASDFNEPGWYLIFLQGGAVYRVYVGQSSDLRHRAKRHLWQARAGDDTKLLYHMWRSIPGCVAKICCLGLESLDKLGFAGDHEEEDVNLFRNLGEMFFSLMFESLQRRHLDIFLPPSQEPHGGHGVNHFLPLHQGHHISTSVSKLRDSDDPDVKAWAVGIIAERRAKRSAVMKAYEKANPGVISERLRNWERNYPGGKQAIILKLRFSGFKNFVAGQRKISTVVDCDGGIYRSADLTKGDLAVVRVKCQDCGHERDDVTPMYVVATGEYAIRYLSCLPCLSGPKKRADHHLLIPLDADLPQIGYTTVRARMTSSTAKSQWSLFYEGKTAAPPERYPGLDDALEDAVAAVKGGSTGAAAARRFNVSNSKICREVRARKAAGTF